MARMKTFLIYALLVVGFFIFSEFIISVGLNSSYKDIERKDNISQVEITEAKATLVNGKIKGIIKDSKEGYEIEKAYSELSSSMEIINKAINLEIEM